VVRLPFQVQDAESAIPLVEPFALAGEPGGEGEEGDAAGTLVGGPERSVVSDYPITASNDTLRGVKNPELLLHKHKRLIVVDSTYVEKDNQLEFYVQSTSAGEIKARITALTGYTALMEDTGDGDYDVTIFERLGNRIKARVRAWRKKRHAMSLGFSDCENGKVRVTATGGDPVALTVMAPEDLRLLPERYRNEGSINVSCDMNVVLYDGPDPSSAFPIFPTPDSKVMGNRYVRTQMEWDTYAGLFLDDPDGELHVSLGDGAWGTLNVSFCFNEDPNTDYLSESIEVTAIRIEEVSFHGDVGKNGSTWGADTRLDYGLAVSPISKAGGPQIEPLRIRVAYQTTRIEGRQVPSDALLHDQADILLKFFSAGNLYEDPGYGSSRPAPQHPSELCSPLDLWGDDKASAVKSAIVDDGVFKIVVEPSSYVNANIAPDGSRASLDVISDENLPDANGKQGARDGDEFDVGAGPEGRFGVGRFYYHFDAGELQYPLMFGANPEYCTTPVSYASPESRNGVHTSNAYIYYAGVIHPTLCINGTDYTTNRITYHHPAEMLMHSGHAISEQIPGMQIGFHTFRLNVADRDQEFGNRLSKDLTHLYWSGSSGRLRVLIMNNCHNMNLRLTTAGGEGVYPSSDEIWNDGNDPSTIIFPPGDGRANNGLKWFQMLGNEGAALGWGKVEVDGIRYGYQGASGHFNKGYSPKDYQKGFGWFTKDIVHSFNEEIGANSSGAYVAQAWVHAVAQRLADIMATRPVGFTNHWNAVGIGLNEQTQRIEVYAVDHEGTPPQPTTRLVWSCARPDDDN
jgi:hypothetical protein